MPEQTYDDLRDALGDAGQQVEEAQAALRLAEVEAEAQKERADGAVRAHDLVAGALADMGKQLTTVEGELAANRQRWYHDDQSRTECVAGHDAATRECLEGGGKVLSEVEYLTQLVGIWQGLAQRTEDELTAARGEIGGLQETIAAADADRDGLAEQIEAVRVTACELHDFNSPEGEHVEGCFGCRLERETIKEAPDA